MPTSTYMHVCACALFNCIGESHHQCIYPDDEYECVHANITVYIMCSHLCIQLSPSHLHTHTHTLHTYVYTYIFVHTTTHMPTHYTPHRSRSRYMELSGYCWRGPTSVFCCISNKDRQLKGSHVWGLRCKKEPKQC